MAKLTEPIEEETGIQSAANTQSDIEHFGNALADLLTDDVDMAAIARATETHVWRVPRLWALVQALPVEFMPVETLISHFDTACWLSNDEPATVRAIVEHARRILATDLTYPIILSADGRIMDGMHRLAKAFITGEQNIATVQFRNDPEPDYRIPRA